MNPHIPTSIACRIAVDEDLSTSTSKASTTKYEAMTRLQLKQLLDEKDATVTSRDKKADLIRQVMGMKDKENQPNSLFTTTTIASHPILKSNPFDDDATIKRATPKSSVQ